ncbi:MAG: threonine synthase [Peptococcaceae bacterium]|nr:threonine synthase [Peptococcaceae bacterium]
MWQGLINKYRDYLPVSNNTPIISLGEGNTPLVRLESIGKSYPKLTLYIKYEGANPTGSFKDRGMTLAVSKAKEKGSEAVICASTGNTSASAAAYAARAGMRCVVLIPDGKIALGKLAQALHYGATVISVRGNFDEVLEITRDLVVDYPLTLVNSINPYRIEGQKTAAFEVIEQLGKAPDCLAIPVGNAGNISAYWKGFKERAATAGLPAMLGFEAEGSAAIVRGYPIKDPETIATAIRIGNPASWETAVAARNESGGVIEEVTDDEILAAYRLLGRSEGIFCEPASAASLAGVFKLYTRGYFKRETTVVCVLTGNGLKDPESAITGVRQPQLVDANRESIEKALWS